MPRKREFKEFLDYNGGSGIQHIAFQVDDIIAVIERMRKRGVEFLEIPQTYYKLLKLRLGNSDLEVKEDLDTVRHRFDRPIYDPFSCADTTTRYPARLRRRRLSASGERRAGPEG